MYKSRLPGESARPLPAGRQNHPRAESEPGAGDPGGDRREEKDSAGRPASQYQLLCYQRGVGFDPRRFIHELAAAAADGRTRKCSRPLHQGQPSVHQSCALVLLTMIRVLAYTLSKVFYHRQVDRHARQTPPSCREMARLLAYCFLLPRVDSS
jgi:hypothetical protein